MTADAVTPTIDRGVLALAVVAIAASIAAAAALEVTRNRNLDNRILAGSRQTVGPDPGSLAGSRQTVGPDPGSLDFESCHSSSVGWSLG